jgi:LmbE family N-acetylglucosaminyl deacetylase
MINKIKNRIRTVFYNKFIIEAFKNNVELGNIDNILNSFRLNKNRPSLVNKFEAKKIIVIAPHPDDEVIGPGGTLIKEVSSGAEVTIIYVTGNNNSERKREAISAANFLKVSAVFLNMTEGDISIDPETLSVFANELNKIEADKIYIPLLCDDHDDHKRVNQLLLASYEKEYIEKKNIEIWCYQIYTVLPANYIVDITDVIEKKKQAIKLYKSQENNRDWAHWAAGLNAFNTRFLSGSPNKRYAETFFLLSLSDYMDICRNYFNTKASNYSNDKYK